MKKVKKGFTLIEVMVVVAIIGILAAVLVPQVGKMIDKGKEARAKGDVRSIANAILEFHNDTGTWPFQYKYPGECWAYYAEYLTDTSVYGGEGGPLVVDRGVPGWNGPYLDKDIGLDPWGNHYFYEEEFDEISSSDVKCTENYSHVWTRGPNKKPELDEKTRTVPADSDDIVIWLE